MGDVGIKAISASEQKSDPGNSSFDVNEESEVVEVRYLATC